MREISTRLQTVSPPTAVLRSTGCPGAAPDWRPLRRAPDEPSSSVTLQRLLRGGGRCGIARGLRFGRQRLLILLPLRFDLLAFLGRQFFDGFVLFTRNTAL